MEFFQSKPIKKFYATLLTIVFVFSVFVPFTAFAQSGTMGTENPRITATYQNSLGEVCQGDSLAAGEYDIDIILSGMQSVSIFQFIADSTDAITINSFTTIADRNSEFVIGSMESEDHNFTVLVASDNEDTTNISSSGEVMISLNVTVNTPGDFRNYFIVSDDPECTFIEADFNDGFEKSYVTVANQAVEDKYYPNLVIDLAPALVPTTFKVIGTITIAEDVQGNTGSFGVGGITVSIDGTEISATSNPDGSYTLENVPAGTHILSISGPTTIDRTATLTVSADDADGNGDITVGNIPMVVCNYSKDDAINAADGAQFLRYLNTDYVYANLNGDTTVNAADGSVFLRFMGKTINYSDVAL